MSQSYKVASIVIGCVTLINLVTTVLVLNNDKIEKNGDSFTTLISAPSEVLKQTVVGILGFITGSVVEASSGGKKRREEELEKRNAELEAENQQLKELNGI